MDVISKEYEICRDKIPFVTCKLEILNEKDEHYSLGSQDSTDEFSYSEEIEEMLMEECDVSYGSEIEEMQEQGEREGQGGQEKLTSNMHSSSLEYNDDESCSTESTISQLTSNSSKTALSRVMFEFEDGRIESKFDDLSCRLYTRHLRDPDFYADTSVSTLKYDASIPVELNRSQNEGKSADSNNGTENEVSSQNIKLDQYHHLTEKQLEEFVTANDELLPNLKKIVNRALTENARKTKSFELKSKDAESRNGPQMLVTQDKLQGQTAADETEDTEKYVDQWKEASLLESIGDLHMEKHEDEAALKSFTDALALRKRLTSSKNIFKNLFSRVPEGNKDSFQSHADTAMKIGILLERVGRNNEARQRYLEALSKLKELYGMSHFKIALIYNRLASLDSKKNEDAAAITNYKTALLIFEQIETNPIVLKDYVGTLCDMGMHYSKTKNPEQAILLYNKALELLKTYADNDDMIAYVYHQMGLAYRDSEKYNEAIKCYSKELLVLKKNGDDKRIIMAKRSIGDCCYFAEMNNEGIEMYKDIVEKIGCEDKVAVLNKLSILYGRKNAYGEALSHSMEARSLCSKNDDINAKDVFMTYNNLGNVYSELDEIDNAQKCYNRALDIHNKTKDGNVAKDDYTSGMLYNLGVLYFKRGSLTRANEYFVKFLETLIPIDVKNSRNRENIIKVTKALNNMGNIRATSRDYDEAIIFYQDSLKLKVHLYGENSVEIFGTLCNLGTAYFEIGHYYLAQSIFESLLDRMEKVGENGLVKAIVLNKLGNVNMTRKEFQTALTYYRQSLEIKLHVLNDKNHEEILLTHHNMALVLCQEKRYEEAISILLEVNKQQAAKIGEFHPLIAKISLDVANAYISMNRVDDAETYCLVAMKALHLAHVPKTHPYLRQSQKTFKKVIAIKNSDDRNRSMDKI